MFIIIDFDLTSLYMIQSSMKQNSYLLRSVVIGEIYMVDLGPPEASGRLVECSARTLKSGLYWMGEDREETVEGGGDISHSVQSV